MQHYLAYGSNLHPLRLAERVPSSRLVGVARLTGYTVSLAKRSWDRSAKCTLACTDRPVDVAHCAVYEIDDGDRHLLDSVEGLGEGYDERRFEVRVDGRAIDAFAYVAAASHLATGLSPYDWYMALVLEGARYHGFPAAYIASLSGIPCMPDPDLARNRRNAELLERIRMLNSARSSRLQDHTQG